MSPQRRKERKGERGHGFHGFSGFGKSLKDNPSGNPFGNPFKTKNDVCIEKICRHYS
jgi:hypothetical protein